MKRLRPGGKPPSGNYPPIYYTRLRNAARVWWIWFAIITTITALAAASFIYEWMNPLMFIAPWVGAIWLYSVLVAWFSRYDMATAAVLPYFLKKGPRVDADTFLYGHALARNFQIMEAWAHEKDVLPLSTFGWNDDLSNETVVWHEAALGVQTVKALLEHPELAPEVREDLERLLSALQRARDVGTPFCLLLRHGNSASGAEMDARQGTFF